MIIIMTAVIPKRDYYARSTDPSSQAIPTKSRKYNGSCTKLKAKKIFSVRSFEKIN